jgi:hypothetical protein
VEDRQRHYLASSLGGVEPTVYSIQSREERVRFYKSFGINNLCLGWPLSLFSVKYVCDLHTIGQLNSGILRASPELVGAVPVRRKIKEAVISA